LRGRVEDKDGGRWEEDKKVAKADEALPRSPSGVLLPSFDELPLPGENEHYQTWKARCVKAFPQMKDADGADDILKAGWRREAAAK